MILIPFQTVDISTYKKVHPLRIIGIVFKDGQHGREIDFSSRRSSTGFFSVIYQSCCFGSDSWELLICAVFSCYVSQRKILRPCV
ncbi:hypothetical protein HID58_043451 [Brassica napus]|uniref:(rape) hypothetical protein n=1 Tax=Brassica napus TaxID=3708 RepID=A0A816RUU2_BRANA|nr:hypothetical protein HID58_043451 [Brassica napus]CAF2076907.1 unnamed protein product [Brassica napus]